MVGDYPHIPREPHKSASTPKNGASPNKRDYPHSNTRAPRPAITLLDARAIAAAIILATSASPSLCDHPYDEREPL
jgi:hypothetical protein